jgi:hypothetical protein
MFSGGAFGTGTGQHLPEAAEIGRAAVFAESAVYSKQSGGAQGGTYQDAN